MALIITFYIRGEGDQLHTIPNNQIQAWRIETADDPEQMETKIKNYIDSLNGEYLPANFTFYDYDPGNDVYTFDLYFGVKSDA